MSRSAHYYLSHQATTLFQQEDTAAILFVDATNAFNSLNPKHNICHLCPSLITVLINTYRAPTKLFVDGTMLYSSEGTTQGDPLAMPMYALATIPLIKKMQSVENVNLVWYADDASGAGKITRLHEWYNCVYGCLSTRNLASTELYLACCLLDVRFGDG